MNAEGNRDVENSHDNVAENFPKLSSNKEEYGSKGF